MTDGIPPRTKETARRVLTEVQFLTWAMRERGISQRAIAYYRGVTKGTVADCLRDVDTKLKEAADGKDRQARGEPEEGGQGHDRAVG